MSAWRMRCYFRPFALVSSFLSVLFVAMALASAAHAQTTENSYYDAAADTLVSYSVPAHAQINSSTFSVSGSTATLSVRMNGAFPTTGVGQLTVEAYFDTATKDGPFDTAVVYARNYTYASSPNITSGTAGIVDTATFNRLAMATASVSGNTLILTFPVSYVNSTGPNTIIVRYLPDSVNLNSVGGGMNGTEVSVLCLNSDLGTYDVVHPGVPDTSGGGGLGAAMPNLVPPGPVPTSEIPLRWTCPPTGTSIPKPYDINHDGQTDWDYPCDKPWGSRLIDIWGLDLGPAGAVLTSHPDGTYYDDAFIVVVGADLNRNGKLDGNEIQHPIGQCIYPGGRNKGWVDRSTNITHWINMWPKFDAYGHITGYKERMHYIFNPNTNILKVWKDPDGDGPLPPILIYSGPPTGFGWIAGM